LGGLILWSIAYLIFAILGWWTLHQFGKYAVYADKLREYAFFDESHLEKITIAVDSEDVHMWEQFFNSRIKELEDRSKTEEAKAAKADLDRLHDKHEISFKNYDVFWGEEQRRTRLKEYVLAENEQIAKQRFGWLRYVSQWTKIYLILITVLGILALYLILAR
jgi:hypothetical protein